MTHVIYTSTMPREDSDRKKTFD